MRSSVFLLLIILLALADVYAFDGGSQADIKHVARAIYLENIANKRTSSSVESITKPLNINVNSDKLFNQLSLHELVKAVVLRNNKIQIQKTDLSIKQAEEDKTHSIFEPEFVASIEIEDNSQRNSVEESLSRSLASTYNERNWDYAVSINGYIPTGAKYNLGYNLRDLSNTVTQSLVNEDNEYQMYLGISITQPLLKNAGVDITKARIHAAETETIAAFHDLRLEMMQTIYKAVQTYWNYYQAQEKLKLVQDSIRIADKVLVDNRERHRTGKMAETEIYEAMIGLASRKALLHQVEQEHLSAANSLRSILSIAVSSPPLEIRISDLPAAKPAPINRDDFMQRAFQLQPAYLATQAKLLQADIKLSFAKNQCWPELDLSASYGLNGLDFEHKGSLRQLRDAEYDAWSLGMEFRIPLLGGIENRGELNKVKLEKQRLLTALKDVEIKLTNDIDTGIHNMANASERARYANDIVEIQKKLLDTELARLHAGKSTSRLVLEKEDNYRNALETALKDKINLQTALDDLDLAGGTILLKHGVEIMEKKL